MIKVQLLGGASLRSGEAPLAGPPAQRHRIALLSLIVAAWPQPLSRDRAMALLWPERDLVKARRLLNLAVHVLRSALGDDAILSTNDGLLLNPTALSCDLHELRAAIAANDPERIARHYTGALLDGFHLDESAEFAYWLDERRSELVHAFTGALRVVAEDQERNGDLHGRVSTCRKLVAAHPHSGLYARALMRALDAAGDRAGAIRHAAEHARRLEQDLELPPDPEVQALAEELRTAAPFRPSPASARAAVRPRGQAHHLYLQGRRWASDYTLAGLARAVDCYERAVAHDPSFALALAGLAMAYVELSEQGGMPPEVAHRKAGEAAAAALRHDPELGEAHRTAAYLKVVREHDWAGAEQAFKRALELNPEDADAYDLYGRLCAALGRFDEGIVLQRRAQELDPLSHRLDAVSTLIRAGRYLEAVAGARNAVELDPGHDRSRATLGWAYFLSGRQEEGLAEIERAVSLSPNSTLWLGQLGQAYAMAGRTDKAREVLRQLETRARTAYVSPYHLAYVHTGLGEHDRAVALLERAAKERAGAVYGIKGSFLFAALHGHAGFRKLLEGMG
ncbi:MAG TPA: tetratricopeptide repeat protein, partial [Gemmatimonadales bacterium]|nr:tetratricopeptide repeat protein [Gemmatimonadales bacterium]